MLAGFNFSIFRKSFSILDKTQKTKSICMFLTLLFSAVLDLIGLGVLFPLILAVLSKDNFQAYNYIGASSYETFILFSCLGAFCIILIKNIISIKIEHLKARFSYGIFYDLSSKLYRKYYLKGFRYFKEENSTVIFKNIYLVPFYFAGSVLVNTLSILTEGIVLVCIFLTLMYIDVVSVCVLVFLLLPILGFFYAKIKTKLQNIGEKTDQIAPQIHDWLNRSIFGYTDILISEAHPYFFDSYQKKIKEMTRLSIARFVYGQTPHKVIETGIVLTIVFLILYGVVFIKDSEKVLTLLSLYGVASFRLTPSLNRILVSLVNIKAYDYTISILSKENLPQIQASSAAELKNHAKSLSSSELDFKDKLGLDKICFSYVNDGQKVTILDHVSFEVLKGQSLGVIGPSGAGKTTLLNIILQLIKQESGTMYLDEQQIDSEELYAWHNIIGFVAQDVYIVDGSIAENIAFGVPENQIDLGRVEECLRKACLLEHVMQLKDKLNHRIGERGTLFSGGQQQRIGIARALYSGAKILVFDEATSALDSQTEELITESIQNLSSEKITSIIVAHRISTLKYCNQILELEKGRIKQIHTYNALIDKK